MSSHPIPLVRSQAIDTIGQLRQRSLEPAVVAHAEIEAEAGPASRLVPCLGALGGEQAVAFLGVLQKLFTAELTILSPQEGGSRPSEQAPAQESDSEVFEVAPGVGPISVAAFPGEEIAKMIPDTLGITIEKALDAFQVAADDRPELEGLGANSLLTDLFVACDRLRRDPRDNVGVESLVDLAPVLRGHRPPFGIDPALWNDLGGRSGELADLLADGGADGDDLGARASELTEALRLLI